MSNYTPSSLHTEIAKSINPLFSWSGNAYPKEHTEKCRKKLIELLGLDSFEKCEPCLTIAQDTFLGGNKYIKFLVQTERGYFATCHLLFPKGYSGQRLPLCTCLQGHVSGAHLGLGIKKFPYDEVYLANDGVDFCLQATKRGYIALAIEQRGFGENGGDTKTGASRCSHIAHSAILLGRTLIGERVWDVQRVIDAVCDYFKDYITMDSSILMGMSGGGTATYYTACLEERFSLYVPGVALCSFADSIVALEHCACNYIPGIAKYFDMGDLALMIAPKKMVVLIATEDKYFPYDSALKEYQKIKEIYNALCTGENCQLVVGKGDHHFYHKECWPVMQSLLSK